MSLTIVLICGCLGAVPSVRAATVAFADGLLHAVPGDPGFVDGDDIVLTNASQLEIDAPAVVTGAGDTVGTDRTGGPALTIASGTTAVVRGGAIDGGLALASYQGASPTTRPIAVGGAGIDHGGLLQFGDGHVGGGAATALAAPTASRSQADGGPALVVESGRVTIDRGDFRSGGATTGGSRTNNVARSGDVHVVSAGSTLILQGGTHIAADATADNSGISQGDSTAESGHVFDIRSGATVIVHGGTFKTGSVTASSGGGNSDATVVLGSAVRIDDGARLVIYGGDFSPGNFSFVAAPGVRTRVPSAAIRVDVTGASTPTRIVVLGGSQLADYALDIPFTSKHVTDARVVIGATDLRGWEGELRLSHPDVTTELLGAFFSMNGSSVELGPINATSGTLTVFVGGRFRDIRFVRQNGAPLVLPEPTQALWPAMLVLAGLATDRRGHTTPLLRPPRPES